MADAEREETGREFLEACWWDALDELRLILFSDNSPAERVAAGKAILDYTSSLNVGLGDPFIPAIRPEHQVEEEDEE